MSSPWEDMALDIAPPTAYVSTAGYEGSGVVNFATTNGSVLYVIPSEWKGNMVTFKCVGLALQIAFGPSTMTTTINQVSSRDGSGNITKNAATGYQLDAGERIDWRIPEKSTITHFTITSTAATGYLHAYMSVNSAAGK